MKVYVEIANGYKPRIAKIMSDNPSFTKLEATTRFIETVYGKWINENTGTDYTFENITTSDFVINFTYDDDAHLFIQKIGGRILED